jgi:hypothetical protein
VCHIKIPWIRSLFVVLFTYNLLYVCWWLMGDRLSAFRNSSLLGLVIGSFPVHAVVLWIAVEEVEDC